MGLAYAVHRSQGPPWVSAVRQPLCSHAKTPLDGGLLHAGIGRRGHQNLSCPPQATGAGGYGTLPEYLVLDQTIDEIQPTMILWQFCTNDFISNDHDLE